MTSSLVPVETYSQVRSEPFSAAGQIRMRLLLPPKAAEQPAGLFRFGPAPLFNLDLWRKHMEGIEEILLYSLQLLSLEQGAEVLNICDSLARTDLGQALSPWTTAQSILQKQRDVARVLLGSALRPDTRRGYHESRSFGRDLDALPEPSMARRGKET